MKTHQALHYTNQINRKIGNIICWLPLIMVLLQFTIVIMRYVYGTGSLILQESMLYMQGLLFMLAAAETLRRDAHVRIDIFYGKKSKKFRLWVDLLGSLFFLLPFSIFTFIISYPYIRLSWMVREGSREASGIEAVYLLKTSILLFALLLGLQAICSIASSILHLRRQE